MNFTENTLFDISSGFVLSEAFTVSHLNTNIVSTKKGLNHVNGTPKTPLWQKTMDYRLVQFSFFDAAKNTKTYI